MMTAHRRAARRSRRPLAVIATRLFAPEPAATSFRLTALADTLDSRGYDVRVLTTTVPGGEKADVAPDVQVRRWPVLRDRAGYVRGYVQYLSFDLPLIGRLLFGRRPAIVISEPPPTTGLAVRFACGLRRIPYVYYAADLWSEALHEVGSPAPVRWVVRQIESLAMRGAAAVVAVHETYLSRIEHLRVSREKVSVVGNGTNTQVFRPDGPHPELPQPYLVYAGTASEVHGASLIIEAMPKVLAELPDARLVVIGQGLERPSMERAARQLSDGAVTFFPRLSGEKTASWLRGARAALASVRPGPYGFAVATKMFAAAACGTPVLYISDDGPGADAVRESDLGEVVPYDVGRVADAMVRTLRSSVAESERARLAIWACENASLPAVAGRVVDTVDRVLAPNYPDPAYA